MRKLTIIQLYKPDPESVDPIEIDASRMVKVTEREGELLINGYACLDVRQSYEFADKAIYLNLQFDWVKGTDSDGVPCLVPLKKLA